jgi:hypothetical protein
MVEFIHSLTGSKMLVAEDRVEEYKAAGHKLAAKNSKANSKSNKKGKQEELDETESSEKELDETEESEEEEPAKE